MNPIALLGWWKEILIGLLVIALGVQSYRLQGAKAERDILALEKTERTRRDAMRDAQNLKNKERTDEEYRNARKRAATVLVRGDAGAGIRAGKAVELAGGGDKSPVCFDRGRLHAELAGWVERHAQGLNAAIADIAQLGDRGFSLVAREGEDLAAGFRACRAWAMNLH